MARRLRLGLAAAGISVALVLLMVTAIRAASTYYYTLPQFRALGSAEVGRIVKVNGTVGPGVQWDYQTQELRFDVLAAAADPASGSASGPGSSGAPAASPAPGSTGGDPPGSPPPAGNGVQAVAPLPVVYHGAEPDTFASGISVVVSGRLEPSGTFVAEQVLVKCPSTYVAATSNG